MNNTLLQINEKQSIIAPAVKGYGDKEPEREPKRLIDSRENKFKEPSSERPSDVDNNCKCSSGLGRDESTYPSSLKNVLPLKPYASDKLANGLRILPREKAIKKKYIELNPVHIRKFLTFDVDYDVTWVDIAKDFNIVEPHWTVINRENGHAHLIYVLKTPVCCTSAAHLKPLRYLHAIVKAMTRKLEADPRYCGLMSKNPFNKKAWFVRPPLWHEPREYTLSELADCVPDEMYEEPIPVDENVAGLGRNCYIFEHVRVRAYREYRNFWSKDYDEWSERVHYMCEEENSKFEEPLGQSEIHHIAKSLANWTAEIITPEGFSEYQRNIINLRWSKESLKKKGQELLSDGYSVEAVMDILDVSRRTVYYWKDEIVKINQIKKMGGFSCDTMAFS